MPEQPLNELDKFALREAMTTASHTKLPPHTKKTVEATPEGETSLVNLTCPGSGQQPARINVENVGHPTLTPNILALCPGSCGKTIQWNYTDSQWIIR